MEYSAEELNALKTYISNRTSNLKVPQSIVQTIYDCLHSKYMPTSIGKYLRMNNQSLNPSDIKQDYWLGVVLGLKKVSIDVGDPFFFLSTQGRYQVLNSLKRQLKATIHQFCECGHSSTLQHNMKCGKCGSENTISTMIEEFFDNQPFTPDISTNYDLQVHYILKMFKGRKREILELLLDENSVHHPTISQNYLKSIGDYFGVSAVAIAKHIKKIRAELQELYFNKF